MGVVKRMIWRLSGPFSFTFLDSFFLLFFSPTFQLFLNKIFYSKRFFTVYRHTYDFIMVLPFRMLNLGIGGQQQLDKICYHYDD